MLLSEFGSQFNKARRAKHLSLADLSEHLDIPVSVLQSIENGSPELLKTAENRHTIKVYAVALGIPAALIARQLNSIQNSPDQGKTKLKSLFPFLKYTWFRRILASVIILLFASVVYSKLTSNTVESKLSKQTSAEVNNTSAKEKSSSPSLAEKNTDASASASAKLEQTTSPTKRTAPFEQISQDDSSAQKSSQPSSEDLSGTPQEKTWSAEPSKNLLNIMKKAEPIKPTQKELSTSQALQKKNREQPKKEKTPVKEQKKGHQLEIYAASGNCWVGYTADGEESQKVLTKGKSFSIEYKKTLNLVLGNPSVVVMHNDGVALDRTEDTKLYFASGASAKQPDKKQPEKNLQEKKQPEKNIQEKKQPEKTAEKQIQDPGRTKRDLPRQAEKTPALAEGEHQIKIFAQDGPCWIGYTSGNINKQLLLRQGEVHTFIFKNTASLQFGNINAVRIYYDGRETQRVYSSTLVTRKFPPKTK